MPALVAFRQLCGLAEMRQSDPPDLDGCDSAGADLPVDRRADRPGPVD
jgi:hypothetical protein